MISNSNAPSGGTGPWWPNDVTLYLDPRFDTIMFRVVPPGISSVIVTKTRKNVVLRISDSGTGDTANTALDTGALDVFVCPSGKKVGCRVNQGQAVASVVYNSFVTNAVRTVFPLRPAAER